MLKKILATLAILFVLSASASARIAVLHSHDSDSLLAQNLTARLSTYSPSQRFFLNDGGAIPQLLENNPNIELLVILSKRIALDYARIVGGGGEQAMPHVSILRQRVSSESLSVLLRSGIVVIPKHDPILAVRGISKRYRVNIRSMGYIHCDDTRNAAFGEMRHLQSAGISAQTAQMRVPIAARSFERALYRFYDNEISVIRLLNSQMFLSFFQANPDMISLVERLTSVLLTDSREFARMFPFAPVAVMEPNVHITERVAAMIVIAALRETSSKPRFSHPVTMHSTRVTLFEHEQRQGINISAEFENAIFMQIDRKWQQFIRPNVSSDSSWAIISRMGSLVDTTGIAAKPGSPFASASADMIAGFDRMVETRAFGYSALGVIILMLILKIAKLFKRKQYKRKVAMLMPNVISKTTLIGTEGHNISLKFLLESEGYRIKMTSSKGGLKKVLRKTFPNVIIADWDAANSTLQSCYLDFTKSPKFKQLVIVLMNIPLNKQTQIKKLYEGTSVHCYEDAPTLDEILGHLRGDKHFSSSDDSYLSGVILEDNLTAILQMVEGNNLTGCLVVEDDQPISVIYFRGGRVVYAVDKSGESGIKAIYNALSCRRGGFYFHLNRASQSENLSLGTMEILMGWADQRDRFTEKVKAIEETQKPKKKNK